MPDYMVPCSYVQQLCMFPSRSSIVTMAVFCYVFENLTILTYFWSGACFFFGTFLRTTVLGLKLSSSISWRIWSSDPSSSFSSATMLETSAISYSPKLQPRTLTLYLGLCPDLLLSKLALRTSRAEWHTWLYSLMQKSLQLRPWAIYSYPHSLTHPPLWKWPWICLIAQLH